MQTNTGASNMIYCFGNSHVALFSGAPPCGNKTRSIQQKAWVATKEGKPIVIEGEHAGKGGVLDINPENPQFRGVYLGGVLCYNFLKNHAPTVRYWLDSLKIQKEKDKILFYVGEIDCRVHLSKKYMTTDLSKEEVVNECVERYFKALKMFSDEGWDVIVCGTHPTNTLPHSEKYPNINWGDVSIRNSICVIFNSALKSLCEKNSISFVSIYDKLVDENNITKPGVLKDFCHMNYDFCFPLIVDEMERQNLCDTRKDSQNE